MEKREYVLQAEQFAYPSQILMLASGGCPAILPVDVVQADDRVQLFYQVADRQRLDRFACFAPGEALSLMRAVLEMIDLLRRWLWFPEEYRLAPDTIYLDGEGCPQLLFLPDREAGTGRERLLCLLDYVHDRTGETGQIYLETLGTFLDGEGLRLGRVEGLLDELLAEVRTLGLG